ncbi:MAG: hypothetical protein HZC45_08875, partial [Deltaproteobacteria bacterium]|nr:hypothetical protein [Deltaproteobacteria bacterium]
MGRRKDIIYFSIFLFCFLSFYETQVYAKASQKIKQEIVKKGKKLESVEKKLEAKKQKLDIINKKETSVLTILDRTERELARKEDELSRFEKNLKDLKIKIDAADKDIRELVIEREKLLVMLKKRVVSMYKMREGGVVRLLFSSDSVNDFSRRYKYINAIIDSDFELLNKYDKNREDLEDKKEKLDGMKSLTLSLKERAEVKKREIAAE